MLYAVCRFYDARVGTDKGKAAKSTDLVTDDPRAPEFMADGHKVASTLSHISTTETPHDDEPVKKSPCADEIPEKYNSNGFKFWPVKTTREKLREMGLPTAYPNAGPDNGGAIDFDLTKPKRVADDGEEPDASLEMHDVDWPERKKLTPKQRGEGPSVIETEDDEDDGPFVCSMCGEEFDRDNEEAFSTHTAQCAEVTDHAAAGYTCECGESFAELSAFRAHVGACRVVMENNDKTFECDDCGETFDDLREYQAHAASNCTEDDDTILDDALDEVSDDDSDDDDEEIVYGGSMIDTIMEQSHDFVDISDELDVDESEMEPDVVVNV